MLFDYHAEDGAQTSIPCTVPDFGFEKGLAMTMIQLFDGPGDDMVIDIMAFVDDKTGDLIVEGCNSGPAVEKKHGEPDYEYWLCILKDDKAKLLGSLTGDEKISAKSDAKLLKAIAHRFNTITAFDDLRKWCEQHNVPARFNDFT